MYRYIYIHICIYIYIDTYISCGRHVMTLLGNVWREIRRLRRPVSKQNGKIRVSGIRRTQELWSDACGARRKNYRLTRAQLQVIFCKWATNYRALLRKMTCKDKGSHLGHSVVLMCRSSIWYTFCVQNVFFNLIYIMWCQSDIHSVYGM